jgi:hypothetical protein
VICFFALSFIANLKNKKRVLFDGPSKMLKF